MGFRSTLECAKDIYNNNYYYYYYYYYDYYYYYYFLHFDHASTFVSGAWSVCVCLYIFNTCKDQA